MKTAIKLVLIDLLIAQIIAPILIMIPCTIYLFVTTGNLDKVTLTQMIMIPAQLAGQIMMGIYLWKAGYISKKKATCYFLLIFRIIFLFASLIFDTSMEFRYTCVVFMELCPMPSLIIGMGMSMSLAMLAHVCRAVYVVSGIFNPVISPIFFKL